MKFGLISHSSGNFKVLSQLQLNSHFTFVTELLFVTKYFLTKLTSAIEFTLIIEWN